MIQECYIASNISNNFQAEQRILKYNLLPTTTVFIAVYRGEIIGTVSYILDSSMGLPMDDIADIHSLRESGHRIVEVAGLAIKKKWRSLGGNLFFPLVMVGVHYAHEVLGAEYMGILTNQSGKIFYQKRKNCIWKISFT